jgi:hypothetical protein
VNNACDVHYRAHKARVRSAKLEPEASDKGGPRAGVAVSKYIMRVTKQLVVSLAMLLLALIVGVGLRVFVIGGRSVQGNGRTYEVKYVWDHGIRSLRVTNTETGVEESAPKWRQRVAAVAEKELPKIVESAGLTRAVGRFYADTWDEEARYLPRWGSPSDPELVRDPDVTPLMSALDRGDAAKARELIAAGANVNVSDQHGWTALMRAAAAGDASIVQALVVAGADVNARSKEGETALFPAAFLDRVAVARELVHRGVDVKLSSQKRVTPLMEAAQHSPRVVELLIGSGANVHAKDVLGETALMIAARAGRVDVVQALVRTGADVNAKDNQGRTALSSAV